MSPAPPLLPPEEAHHERHRKPPYRPAPGVRGLRRGDLFQFARLHDHGGAAAVGADTGRGATDDRHHSRGAALPGADLFHPRRRDDGSARRAPHDGIVRLYRRRSAVALSPDVIGVGSDRVADGGRLLQRHRLDGRPGDHRPGHEGQCRTYRPDERHLAHRFADRPAHRRRGVGSGRPLGRFRQPVVLGPVPFALLPGAARP